MNKFEEIVKKSKIDEQKPKSKFEGVKNLKIIIENTPNENPSELTLCDYEELEQDPIIINDAISSQTNDAASDENEDNPMEDDVDTEFHVNLDKAPPTLQNTILNEKVYLNESLKEVNEDQDVDQVSEEQLDALYKSLDLDHDSFINESDGTSTKLYKKHVLHLYGVDDMNTNDIFDFFKIYKPFAIEWIDDNSCNLLWKNEKHCQNAIIGKSKEHSVEADERQPPQGAKWRVSREKLKNGNYLFMRFAKTTDRKIKGAESRSKFYVKYGNPNYGNLKGLISNSRRQRMKSIQLKEATSDLTFDLPNEEEFEKLDDTTGRKLISYNIDEKIMVEDDDLEKFGTGSDKRISVEKTVYKSKKMHLYADDLESTSDSNTDSKDNQNSWKRKRYNEKYEPYKFSRNDRFSRGSKYSNERALYSDEFGAGSASTFRHGDPNDLRFKLNNIRSFRKYN